MNDAGNTPIRHRRRVLLTVCVGALASELLLFIVLIGQVVASARMAVTVVTLSGPFSVIFRRWWIRQKEVDAGWSAWRKAILWCAPWVLIPWGVCGVLLVLVILALRSLQ